jgi:hypothetical protein
MDWKNGYRTNKGRLLVIGAGALVLALIAFSGLCLGTLTLCGVRNAASSLGFWEIFGALSVVVATFLMVRPLRNRRAAGAAGHTVEPAIDDRPADQRADWRELYDQLSLDEQQALKALMAKHLGGERE